MKAPANVASMGSENLNNIYQESTKSRICKQKVVATGHRLNEAKNTHELWDKNCLNANISFTFQFGQEKNEACKLEFYPV